jgi:hypothetical protein
MEFIEQNLDYKLTNEILPKKIIPSSSSFPSVVTKKIGQSPRTSIK